MNKFMLSVLSTFGLAVTPVGIIMHNSSTSINTKVKTTVQSKKVNTNLNTLKLDKYYDQSLTLHDHDNNAKYFVGGNTKEYYYNYVEGHVDNYYYSANLNFTLTSAGSLGLLQNYLQHPSWHCGASIVDYFNKTLKHFDNLLSSSYLNRMEHSGSNYRLPDGSVVYKDKEAYSDFIDNMSQPASVVYQLSALHDEGKTLPSVAVRFHYGHHGFSSDDFDVSFTIEK